MTPQVDISDAVPFHRLGSEKFERLSRELWRKQAGVSSARRFGKNPQGQRGIDILIRLSGREDCWAVQCKAYKNYSKTNLKTAVNDLRKNLKHWRKEKLSRFIIHVGCELDDRYVQEDLVRYREEFKEHGIEIEIWDSDEIAEKLKPFPFIVKKHFQSNTDAWLKRICDLEEEPVSISRVTAGSANTLEMLVGELGEVSDLELDAIRDLIREGATLDAEEKLRQKQVSASWPLLSAPLRAKVLRLHALLVLNQRSSTDEARDLLEDAESLDEAEPSRFHDALLTFHEGKAEEALLHLEKVATIDEWHLRGALLINLDRCEDALELLQSQQFTENAETYRLRATANHFLRRSSEARAEIDRALAESPHWISVTETAAKIYFYSSISIDSPDWGIFAAPVPTRWEFVKSDPSSIKHSKKSYELFCSLSDKDSLDKIARVSIECWKLACLSNFRGSSKQKKAGRLARKILKPSPTVLPAISLALERGYQVPIDEIRTSLEELVRSSPELGAVHTLVVLMVRTNDYEEAARLLDQFRSVYLSADALTAWNFHRVQIAFVNGERSIVEALTDEESGLSVIVSRTDGAKNGWTDSQLSLLSDAYEKAKSASALFTACEAHHLSGHPEYVVEHAEELLRSLPSEDALMLSIDASYAAGAFERCISLSQEFCRLFEGGSVPEEVRRLRASCFFGLGRHADAARELNQIPTLNLSDADRFNSFEAEYASGNMRRAVEIGYELIESDKTTPEGLLHVLTRVRSDDPVLAKKAFRKLTTEEVHDSRLATEAFFESFHLGLEHEARGFLSTATSDIGEPESPLIPFTLEDFIEQMKESEEAQQNQLELYRKGAIPIHFLEARGQGLLSELISLEPDWNIESDVPLTNAWALRIRHGSLRKSRIRDGAPPPEGIFLDITSILLLHRLGLLLLVAEAIPKIRISPATIPWIQKQIHSLTSRQLTTVAAKNDVVSLFEKTLLEGFPVKLPSHSHGDLEKTMGLEWCLLLEKANESGGFLVDFVPVKEMGVANKPAKFLPEIAEKIVGAEQLCNSAKKAGWISHEVHQGCLKNLGIGESKVEPLKINSSTTFVLTRGQAEHLSNIGILGGLAKACNLILPDDEIDEIRMALRRESQRDSLVEELKQIREHLRRRLDAGDYTVDSVPESLRREEMHDPNHGLLISCLRDTINTERSNQIWTCVDDRKLSQLARIGKSRVVGTYDLICFLEHAKRITGNRKLEILRHLRSRNARFIFVDPEEILEYLDSAFTSDEGSSESAELASLRKYYAAVFLAADDLQRPNPQGEFRRVRLQTELRMLLQTGAAASDALSSIWSRDGDSLLVRMHKSNWILDSLWFDSSATGKILSDFAVTDDLERVASQHLIYIGIRLAEKDNSKIGPFFSWLFTRLTSRPERWNPVLSEVKSFLFHTLEGNSDMPDSELRQFIMLKMHERIETALPVELQSSFSLSESDGAMFGEKQCMTVGMGEFQFDASVLWPAAKEALIGASVSIKSLGKDSRKFALTLNKESKTQPGLQFVPEDGGQSFSWNQPVFALLSSPSPDTSESMQRIREELDLSQKVFQVQLDRLVAIEDISRRMLKYSDLEANSFQRQLDKVRTGIETRNTLDFENLRPQKLQSLFKHLRLDVSGSWSGLPTSLETTAKLMLHEEGFIETFMRCASLPFAMPECVVQRFQKLEKTDSEEFQKLARGCDTVPLLGIHVALLLSTGRTAEQSQSVELFSRLISQERFPLFQYFRKILKWSFSCLINDYPGRPCFRECGIAAWIHSGRANQTIGSPKSHIDVGLRFETHTPTIAGLSFSPNLEILENPLQPDHFDTLNLVVSTAARIISNSKLSGEDRMKMGESLKQFCFPHLDSPEHPNFKIYHFISSEFNEPKSLFNFNDKDLSELASLPGLSALQKLQQSCVSNEISQLLTNLQQSPHESEGWMLLGGALGRNCPDDDHQAILSELISGFSFASFEGTSREIISMGMVIFLWSRYPSIRGTEIDWEKLRKSFAEVVLDPDFDDDPSQALVFVAASAFFGLGSDTVEESIQTTVEALRSMGVAENPSPDLRKMISNIANMISGRDNAPLWRLLLEMRAL